LFDNIKYEKLYQYIQTFINKAYMKLNVVTYPDLFLYLSWSIGTPRYNLSVPTATINR